MCDDRSSFKHLFRTGDILIRTDRQYDQHAVRSDVRYEALRVARDTDTVWLMKKDDSSVYVVVSVVDDERVLLQHPTGMRGIVWVGRGWEMIT